MNDFEKSNIKEKSIVSRFVNFANRNKIKSDVNIQKSKKIRKENKSFINKRLYTSNSFIELGKLNEMISMMTLERPRRTMLDEVEDVRPTIPISDYNTNLEDVFYTAHSNSFRQLSLECGSNVNTFSTQDFSTVKEYGIFVKKNPPTLTDMIDNDIVYNIERHFDDKSFGESNSTEDFNKIPKDLRNMIEIFNKNDQGLLMELKSDQIMGKLRVYINLLRPIKMLLITRPPSIFDTFSDNDTDCNQNTIASTHYNKEVLIWLPRGATNLLYVNINCLTIEVISILLTKFNIRNDPKTFALYEHTITTWDKVEVRKLRSCECPLKIMLGWCTEDVNFYHQNLRTKKFVLQENDSGLIEWNEFSIPELKTFLMILEEEEEELRSDIILKYEALRSDINRLLTTLQ